jgi:hypothetical protein
MSKITEALLHAGRVELVKARFESDAKKTPTLRGGSAGAIVSSTKEDKVLGNCHRLAHLRWLGIDVPPAESDYEMFDEGLTNEDIINNLLQAGYRGPILFEEDLPVRWETATGHLVTGRCDAILGEVLSPDELKTVNKEIKKAKTKWKAFSSEFPEIPLNEHYLMSLICKKLGLFRIKKILEYKKKLTYKGIVNVHLEKKPDAAHIIQLGHYSAKMAETYGLDAPVPAELFYRWGFIANLDSEMRMEEVENSDNKDYVENRIFGRKDWIGRPGKINIGHRIYTLTWEDDVLCYETEGLGKIPTSIDIESIERFYEATAKLGETKNLGPRPSAIHPGVGVKAGYSKCGFCKLRPECVGYENNYDVWLDEVKKKCESLLWWRE